MGLLIPPHEAHQLLHAALNPPGSSTDDVSFVKWRQRTLTDLATIFGDDSRAVKDFDRISYELAIEADTDGGSHAIERERRAGLNRGKEEAKALLFGLMQRVRIHEQAVIEERLKAERQKAEDQTSRQMTGRVFIVHGHAHDLKNAVARVVSALGLQEWILHERPDQGRTIIEKFEQESASIDYAVVLCTGDDLAESQKALESSGDRIPKGQLTERARQNVIFELGYFTGKLGRGRVILIRDLAVELPSDLSGVIYISRSDWKSGLVSALAGYSFNPEQTRKALSIID